MTAAGQETDPFAGAFDGDGLLRVAASDALRRRLDALRAQPSAAPRTREGIPAARLAFDAVVARSLHAEEDATHPPRATVTADADGVPLVVAEPKGDIRGAVLHVHGGGWCVGSAHGLAPALSVLAERTSTVVASIEYPLAPEHPHPAALEACTRAADWWLHDLAARRGVAADRVVIAGESAGAHLALLTLLRLRDKGFRLGGAALTYGLFDLANRLPSRHVMGAGQLLIDAQACEFYVRMFLGEAVSADDPAVAPLRLPPEAYADLPPALFCVGTLDPLHDDTIEMNARWKQAGNRSWLAVYEDAPHAFDLLAVPEGRHLTAMREQFIRHCLAD